MTPTATATRVVGGGQHILLPMAARAQESTPTPTATITSTPAPFLQDDFSARRYPWLEEDAQIDSLSYANGGYRMAIKRGPYYVASLIDIHANEWTATFSFTPQGANGTRRAGIAFGSSGATCTPSAGDCYRFYLSSNGELLLVYQAGDGSAQLTALGSGPALVNGQSYRLRADRRLTDLAAWLSLDGGQTWLTLASAPLDASRARGGYFGFLVSAGDDSLASAEATFDDLSVWRVDQLPRP